MEVRKIQKDGKAMTTKEGVELEELRFMIGDEFIPVFNKVLEKVRTIKDTKGKEKQITNYSLKCKVKDKNGQDFRNGEEVFVSLTPAQATSLGKKVAEGVELNQHVFVAYAYKSEKYGDQIGLGLKQRGKAPIDWPE